MPDDHRCVVLRAVRSSRRAGSVVPTAAPDHPADRRRRRTAQLRQLPIVVRQGEPIGPVTAGTVVRVRPHGKRVGQRREPRSLAGVPGAVRPDDHRQVPVAGPDQEVGGTGPDSGRHRRRHHDLRRRVRQLVVSARRGRNGVLGADLLQHHVPMLGQLVHRPQRRGGDVRCSVDAASRWTRRRQRAAAAGPSRTRAGPARRGPAGGRRRNLVRRRTPRPPGCRLSHRRMNPGRRGRRPRRVRVRAPARSTLEPDPAVAGRRREQRGTASQGTQEVLERIDDASKSPKSASKSTGTSRSSGVVASLSDPKTLRRLLLAAKVVGPVVAASAMKTSTGVRGAARRSPGPPARCAGR